MGGIWELKNWKTNNWDQKEEWIKNEEWVTKNEEQRIQKKRNKPKCLEVAKEYYGW